MKCIHDFARNRLQISGQTMKKYYDHRVVYNSYEIGSQVWLHNPIPKKGLSRSLQTNWIGPFVVTHKLNDCIYRIQLNQKSKPKVVHHDKLKLYTGESVPGWFSQ